MNIVDLIREYKKLSDLESQLVSGGLAQIPVAEEVSNSASKKKKNKLLPPITISPGRPVVGRPTVLEPLPRNCAKTTFDDGTSTITCIAVPPTVKVDVP
jgi:hypothetical protein